MSNLAGHYITHHDLVWWINSCPMTKLLHPLSSLLASFPTFHHLNISLLFVSHFLFAHLLPSCKNISLSVKLRCFLLRFTRPKSDGEMSLRQSVRKPGLKSLSKYPPVWIGVLILQLVTIVDASISLRRNHLGRNPKVKIGMSNTKLVP